MKLIILILLLSSCTTTTKTTEELISGTTNSNNSSTNSSPNTSIGNIQLRKEITKIKLGKKLKLWSTYYFTPSFISGSGSYCLRDKNAKCISKGIRHDQKCFIQMQGSGVIDGKMYAYHSAKSGVPRKDSCAKYGKAWRGSGNVRFYVDQNFKYGKGSFNNSLYPFKSIACPPQYRNRTRIYVPAAVGVLVSNVPHTGVFHCDDRGGAIKGNHIDTFLGLIDYSTNWKMKDWARPAKYNPFKHVKSSSSKTFDAFLVIE